MIYIRQELQVFHRDMEALRDEAGQSRRYWNDPNFIRLAESVVVGFDRVAELSGITHGNDRVAGKLTPGRFGLFEDEVSTYRKITRE
jgi:hypothetical protein